MNDVLLLRGGIRGGIGGGIGVGEVLQGNLICGIGRLNRFMSCYILVY